MGYDWGTHQTTCYQMYILEGRSLEDIMQHLKGVHNFTPSKRAFQIQFRRWNFPPKFKPAYKNEQLVERIRQLWEKNLCQREMLRILQEEGFSIKLRELINVRTKFRWLLREPKGNKASESMGPDDEIASLASGQTSSLTTPPSSSQTSRLASPEQEQLGQPLFPPLLEAAAQVVQDARCRGKKARCFPSDMTLDRACTILTLARPTYCNIRTAFEQICHEDNVTKKKAAGKSKWESSKTRLLDQMPQLQSVLLQHNDDLEPKEKTLALDIICTNVTKRVRTMKTRMSQVDAKNLLGINPQQSQAIRIAFRSVVEEAGLTSTLDVTPQQWEALKLQWGQRSELVKKILDETRASQDPQKLRALDLVARDVIKRRRDRCRRRPKKGTTPPDPCPPAPETATATAPGPGSYFPPSALSNSNFNDTSKRSLAASDLVNMFPSLQHDPYEAGDLDMADEKDEEEGQYGPDLSLPRNDLLQPPPSIDTDMHLDEGQIYPSLLLETDPAAAFLGHSYVGPAYDRDTSPSQVFEECPSQNQSQSQSPLSSRTAGCAMFLRPHPASTFVPAIPLWIATMQSPSVQGLQQAAVEKFPGVLCTRVEAIVKCSDGGELPLLIEQDREMAVYLEHLQGAAPVFNVQLEWKPA